MRNNPPPGTRRVRSAHESKSVTVRAAAAAPSRRQQSRWQREQQQQRMLYIGIAALAVVVVAIFAAGLIYDNVIRANQVVAQVGPDSITATELLNEVRPQARALDAQAKQAGSADTQSITDYVNQQKRALPDQVLNDLIDVHINQQEAARRGISVSPSELDDKERQTVAAFNAATNPTPTAEPTSTPEQAATPEANPQAAASPTAAGAEATPATPSPVPTLDEAAYGPALQQLLDRNNLTQSDFRTQLERSLLQQKVQTAIGQDQVPDNEPQVHARQIQLGRQDQQKANDLLQQLQNGADFTQLAQQNSTDTATKDKGGDMGWFPRGIQTKAIDDAVFALEPGALSAVVQDTAGYHILQVLETDPNRPVDSAQLTTLRQKAYNDWLTSQHSSQDVKISLDQSEKDWILGRLGVRP